MSVAETDLSLKCVSRHLFMGIIQKWPYVVKKWGIQKLSSNTLC